MNESMIRLVPRSVVVTAAAYSAGHSVGGKLTIDLSRFNDRPSLILQSVILTDLAKQNAAMDLLLFDTDPSATTFTDRSTLDVADADMGRIAGFTPLTTYASFNANSVACAINVGIPIHLAPGLRTIYAVLVSRGTPTFASTADVALRLGFFAS